MHEPRCVAGLAAERNNVFNYDARDRRWQGDTY